MGRTILTFTLFFYLIGNLNAQCPDKDNLSITYDGIDIPFDSSISAFVLRSSKENPRINLKFTPSSSDFLAIHLSQNSNYDIEQDFIEISGPQKYHNAIISTNTIKELFVINFTYIKEDSSILNCQVNFKLIIIPKKINIELLDISYSKGVETSVFKVFGKNIEKIDLYKDRTYIQSEKIKHVSYRYHKNEKDELLISFKFDNNITQDFVLDDVKIFYSPYESDYIILNPITFKYKEKTCSLVTIKETSKFYVGCKKQVTLESVINDLQTIEEISDLNNKVILKDINNVGNNKYIVELIPQKQNDGELIKFEKNGIAFCIDNVIISDSIKINSWKIRDINTGSVINDNEHQDNKLFTNNKYSLIIEGEGLNNLRIVNSVLGLYELEEQTASFEKRTFNLFIDCNADIFLDSKEIIINDPSGCNGNIQNIPLSNVTVGKKEFKLCEQYFDIFIIKDTIKTEIFSNGKVLWLDDKDNVTDLEVIFKNQSLKDKCGDNFVGDYTFTVKMLYVDPDDSTKNEATPELTITSDDTDIVIPYYKTILNKFLESNWGNIKLVIKDEDNELNYIINKSVQKQLYLRKFTLSNLQCINISDGSYFSGLYTSFIPLWYGIDFYKNKNKIKEIKDPCFLESFDFGFIGSVASDPTKLFTDIDTTSNFNNLDLGIACAFKLNPLNFSKIKNSTDYKKSDTYITIGTGYLFDNKVLFVMIGLGLTIK